MQDNHNIIFRNRFRMIHAYLGVIGYFYVGNGCKGIDRDQFISETGFFTRDTSSILALLENHGIIYEREGSLHLDLSLFYTMTMWDLLLIAEPWLRSDDPPPGLFEDHEYVGHTQVGKTEQLR